MAEWQERVQSMIMGFVFAYMVMKLFAVIANFRAGNMRVERAADREDESTLLASTSEAEVETETEAEQEPREDSSSSSSDEEEGEDAAPVVESKEEVEGLEKKDAVELASTLKAESEEETGGGAFEEEEEMEDDEKELEDWEGVESTELEKLFGAASTFADTMMVNPTSSEATLQLHAFYKIATEGPCSSSQPSAFQPTARAKWNAWQKLGSMSQEEAMQKYIAVVTEINPNWCEDYRKSKDLPKEATQPKQADNLKAA